MGVTDLIGSRRTQKAAVLSALLILSLGALLPGLSLEAMDAANGSAVTVHTRFRVTGEMMDGLEWVPLPGLSQTPEQEADFVAWRWCKETSPWGFEFWSVQLHQAQQSQSDTQNNKGVRLADVAPQIDHVYEATLSYDTVTGTLSLSLVDLTDATRICSFLTELQESPRALLPFVPATSEQVRITELFVPAGIDWQVLTDLGQGDLLPSAQVSKQREAFLRIVNPHSNHRGAFRLVAEAAGRQVEWATGQLAPGETLIPLEPARLSAGRWTVYLEFSHNQQTYRLGAPRQLQVVEGVITAAITNVERRRGEVGGLLLIQSDGLLENVEVKVYGDLFCLQDGEWEMMESGKLLYTAVVDVPSQPIELPFSLGGSIPSDIALKVSFKIRTEEERRGIILMAGNDERILRPGDAETMGGIPQLDIAGETWRLTVVDHVPGTYLGHPHTVLLDDGETILVVYPLGHGGPTALKRSTDGGKSWSERLPVPENWANTADVPTIFRLVDPEGSERLIVYQNMTRAGLAPKPANREDYFSQSVSLDGGQTWTPFTRITLNGQVAPNTMVPISGGRYLMVFQRNGTIQMSITADGGQTWEPQRTIATHPIARLTEPAAVKSPDGSEIAVLIRENSRQYNSMLIRSKDEGLTWSDPVELPIALTGDRHMPRYGPDGRLVITFRDMAQGSPTYGDFVAWVGTYEDLVNLSPGQYRVRLLDNTRNPWDTGYAGLELLPDGTFVSTTYCPVTLGAPPSVVSLRFKLEELDALLAKQQAESAYIP